MDASVTSAYAQLMSVGLLWITFHCAGMCGPLILGLNLGGVSSSSRFSAPLHVLFYQLGKALSYAMMGFTAGLLGHTVSQFLPAVTPWITGALGLLLMAHAWRSQSPQSPLLTLGKRSVAGKVFSRVTMALEGQGALRSVALGVVLSVIPCGVVVWALALAASTRHPLHGAMVMVLLAVMTSVPLMGVSLLPKILGVRGLGAVQRFLLPLSGAWMVLVSAAALGVLPHASFGFVLGGQGYVVMFF